MKLTLALILPVALLFLSGCGGPDVDGIKADMRQAMEEMITVLDSVESTDDLDAATPKLEVIVARQKELKARMNDAFSGRPQSEREAATADLKNDTDLARRFADATLKATKVHGGLTAILPIIKDLGD